MKTFFTLFLLILISNFISAQITFEKRHFDIFRILSVDQTNDEGYIIGTQNKSVVKLDKYGDVAWTKYLPSYNTFAYDVLNSSDNKIMVLTTNDGDKSDIFLHKLDNDGHLIWTKKYGTPEDDNGYWIRELSDSGFIIIGTQLIRTDREGNVVWQKESPVNYGVSNFVLAGNNDRIYIAKNGNLNCLNSSGDLLWSKSFKIGNYSIIELQNHLYYSGAKQVLKIDLDGNVIWTKSVSDFYSIADYDSNHFVIASKDSLIKLNTDFDVIWAKKIPSNTLPKTITRSGDNAYIMTGEYGWILKTDINGNHKSLHIVLPYNNESIKPLPYTIKWLSYGVTNLTLEYSKDNGNSWQTYSNVLSNTDSVNWDVPEYYGDYLLKIYDSSDPDTRDYAGPVAVHWNQDADYIAVNQVKMWVGNNGMGSHDAISDGAGFFWPGGQNITASFADGLVWGGKVNGKVNVNGSTYRYGLTPGKILNNGSADNRNSYRNAVWKINKYWESKPVGDSRKQFESNYQYWPGDMGAPFKDLNGDGNYTKGTDQPDFVGDEVLWMVGNDLDSNTTKFVYGSTPVGLEIQTTIYAFGRGNELDDVVFKKYKIINKGNNAVEDMYLSYWSDPDLGNALDDFVGCDTTLDMAYCYNADNDDESYYGSNPPAIGYKIIQGPVISSPGDSAIYNNHYIKNKKNLSSSSFYFYLAASEFWVDPILGLPDGAKEFYNQMQGKHGDGKDVIDPLTQKVTKFSLYGDPVNGTGWYEGPGWPGGMPKGDRRMVISAGPFNFAPQDTQEIVIAIIMARSSDNIASISELRRKADVVQDIYNTGILTGVQHPGQILYNYDLQQNYPNPFNPATTIRYSLAENTNVEIIVYDILGKKVAALVNEEKPAGEYSINFNAANLASGVYSYQLKTDNFISARKMLLVK